MAQAEKKPKIFNDSIHGYIEMHPLCVAIIDTEQFQRLRCIKQMGGTYFVYPGASHNRFEHSIGTSYLAGYFVESLRSKQEELGIDDKDVLCVKIAGLCHDLGHGPFSHMFDNDFIPKVRHDKKWSHEDASEKMFEHLIESNEKVQAEMFVKFDLNEKDKNFIKRLMTGKTPTSEEEWSNVGREKNKRFLFEIVANKINGIDVDKWDYFARDCRHLGIKSSFDHMRCIPLARVIQREEEYLPHICFRDIAVGDIYDLFHTRLSIHKKACQHKTGNIIEMMLTEALEKANSYLKFIGKDGKEQTMSTAIDDMVAYTKLTDHVYYQILYFDPPDSQSEDEDVKKMIQAKEILKKIEKRELYKFIGYTIPEEYPPKEKEETFKEQIFNIVKKNTDKLEKDDIIVQLTSFSYGGKKPLDKNPVDKNPVDKNPVKENPVKENPVDKVLFYAKDDKTTSLKSNKDQVSRMLPQTFIEMEIRVYCKKRDQDTKEKMRVAFDKWCDVQGYQKRFYNYSQLDKVDVA